MGCRGATEGPLSASIKGTASYPGGTLSQPCLVYGEGGKQVVYYSKTFTLLFIFIRCVFLKMESADLHKYSIAYF